MNKTKLASLTAIALAMLLSCSSNEGMLPDPDKNQEQTYDYCVISHAGWCLEGPFTAEVCENSGGMPSNNCPYNTLDPASSSSNANKSSSSSGSSLSSSSKQQGKIYGASVTYQGETYQTVVIGTQTWFAKNLNYNLSGSWCYDNLQPNCDKYGRLYDWATAMALPSSCNASSCSSQINAKHKGICPTGWHIPTYDEWDMLSNYVHDIGCFSCDGDGTLLKTTDGWYNRGNGTDAYGFAALPGGYSFSAGGAGSYGSWWSASEDSDNFAYNRIMRYDYEFALWEYDYKPNSRSVRCVQD